MTNFMSLNQTKIQTVSLNPSLLAKFWRFVSHPIYPNFSPKEKKIYTIWHIFQLWSFCMLFIVVLGIITGSTLHFFGYDLKNFAINKFLENNKVLTLFLLASIWAPFAEEITFRLGLRFTPLNLSLSLSFLLLFILRGFFDSHLPPWLFTINNFRGILSFVFSGLILTLCLMLIFHRSNIKKFLHSFFYRYFFFIFYFFSFLFAFFHITNYASIGKIWFLIPLLVAPQFLVGVLLGFVRLRYGITWSILGHFWHNTIATVPFLIISLLSEDLLFQILNNGDNQSLDFLTPQSLLILTLCGFFFIILGISCLIAIILLLTDFRFQKISALRVKN